MLATSGCVSSPGGPIAYSFTERGVFAQSSEGAHGTAIGGIRQTAHFWSI